jgi:hypothetical protein
MGIRKGKPITVDHSKGGLDLVQEHGYMFSYAGKDLTMNRFQKALVRV